MSDKLLFIHVPKTGGLSIVTAMREGGLDFYKSPRSHFLVSERAARIGSEFENVTSFAVVRNPITRYASACRQLRLNPNSGEALAHAKRQYRSNFKGRLLLTQSQFLMIDDEIAVKNIFKFEEDIPEGVYDWLVEQGLEGLDELPHRHNRRAPLPELKPEVEEEVRKIYARDFEAFGYE